MVSARSLLPRNFDRFPGNVELSYDPARRLWLAYVASAGGVGVAECSRLSIAVELALRNALAADWIYK